MARAAARLYTTTDKTNHGTACKYEPAAVPARLNEAFELADKINFSKDFDGALLFVCDILVMLLPKIVIVMYIYMRTIVL